MRCKNSPIAWNSASMIRLFNALFLSRPAYWSRQREICESVVKYRVTCAYTGNMVGKSYLAAGLIIWWLMTRPDSLVFVSGPSQTNLGAVLFREIKRALEGAAVPFGGRLSGGIKASPQVVEIAPGWQCLGFSSTSVERMSGQHSGSLLAVIEEASGIDDFVWDAVDSLGYNRLLCIGNPLRAEGKFVDLIRQAGKDQADNIPAHLAVNAIQIPSTESPDAHLEHSEFGLADATWINSTIRKHGERSLYCGCHVFAKIPDVDAEALIPVVWLDWHRAQKRSVVSPGHPVEHTRAIAVDLGEGVGRDSTCVVVVDAWGVLEVEVSNTAGLGEAAEAVSRLSRKWRVDHRRISFDKLGVGRGFPSHLARHGIVTAVPYAGEGRTSDPTSFTNLRTECGWRLRDRLNLERNSYSVPFHFNNMGPHLRSPRG